EVNHIASFLESQFLLDPADARRLDALKLVFLRQPPSIAGIGKQLKAVLTAEQLESVGEFLVGVAVRSGHVDKKEVAALRAAYRAMGIGVTQLERQLVECRRLAKEPVEVRPTTGSPDDGEAIPPRPAFRLDPALLEKLMRETRQVASLLEAAMREEEPD